MARLLQNIIENHEDFADSFSVRFLKLRISKELEDENEAFALAKECINEPSHLWMAKNLFLINMSSICMDLSVPRGGCRKFSRGGDIHSISPPHPLEANN